MKLVDVYIDVVRKCCKVKVWTLWGSMSHARKKKLKRNIIKNEYFLKNFIEILIKRKQLNMLNQKHT